MFTLRTVFAAGCRLGGGEKLGEQNPGVDPDRSFMRFFRRVVEVKNGESVKRVKTTKGGVGILPGRPGTPQWTPRKEKSAVQTERGE